MGYSAGERWFQSHCLNWVSEQQDCRESHLLTYCLDTPSQSLQGFSIAYPSSHIFSAYQSPMLGPSLKLRNIQTDRTYQSIDSIEKGALNSIPADLIPFCSRGPGGLAYIEFVLKAMLPLDCSQSSGSANTGRMPDSALWAGGMEHFTIRKGL